MVSAVTLIRADEDSHQYSIFYRSHISEANIAHKQDNIANRNEKTAQLIQLKTTLYMVSLSYAEEKQDIIKPEKNHLKGVLSLLQFSVYPSGSVLTITVKKDSERNSKYRCPLLLKVKI